MYKSIDVVGDVECAVFRAREGAWHTISQFPAFLQFVRYPLMSMEQLKILPSFDVALLL